ncbi:MAG: hypothetical protein JSV92_04020 [archaeon]|nr:MAG: hypothetical protein JSV92_04020 [archaeon]
MNQDVELIFEPRADPIEEPMRIAVLFSGGASGVPFMVGGETYKVVGAISSGENASGIKKIGNLNIPVRLNDIHKFYKEYDKPIKDMKVRDFYYDKDWEIIEEEDWLPDIIANSGHMYYNTPRFLNRLPNRFLNVHPAFLPLLGEDGKRKYTGDDAVTDAMNAGEKFTYSTIHIMDENVDGGPILYVSDSLPVGDRTPNEQQELMKEKCDGPAYKKTLDMLSRGLLGIDSEKNIYLKKGDEFVMTYRHGDNKYFAKNFAYMPGPEIKRF